MKIMIDSYKLMGRKDLRKSCIQEERHQARDEKKESKIGGENIFIACVPFN